MPKALKATTDGLAEPIVPLTFYPAYCNKVSPTWFTWVKITAHAVHNDLRPRLAYGNSIAQNINGHRDGPNLLLFYLNHPIQFVQLVGVVVTFEDYFERFWLFTIDDSSGATIEVNCRRPAKQVQQDRDGAVRNDGPVLDPGEIARSEVMHKIDIGHVVQVKGTITTFRATRQIQLERIAIVSNTTREMQMISARTKTQDEILSRPWVVSPLVQKSLLKKAHHDGDNDKERANRRRRREGMKQEREKRHMDEIARAYEREEHDRASGAERAKAAGAKLQEYTYSHA